MTEKKASDYSKEERMDHIADGWRHLLDKDKRGRLVTDVDRLLEDVIGYDPDDRDVLKFLRSASFDREQRYEVWMKLADNVSVASRRANIRKYIVWCVDHGHSPGIRDEEVLEQFYRTVIKPQDKGGPTYWRGICDTWYDLVVEHTGASIPQQHWLVAPDALVGMARKLLQIDDAVKEMCAALQEFATEYTVPDGIKDKLWADANGNGDRRECPGCGLLKYYEDFHLDHIIPSSRVRIHVEENLQLLCGSCNIKKGNKLT